MGKFAAKNKDYMKTFDPTGKLYDLVSSLEDEINAQKSQTGATGVGAPTAPAPPTKLTVVASGGIFQANIVPSEQGVNHVLEYSPTANFPANPAQIPLALGATQYRGFLGNQTLFWRVRAGNQTAPHAAPLSAPTYHGTAASPTPVIGGGATIGPPA
jgi:hypothetical protein